MDKRLAELNFRRALARGCIKLLSGTDDPRQAEAMQRTQGQLASIDKQIEEITGTPPPVVVGLATAVLFPEVPNIGGK